MARDNYVPPVITPSGTTWAQYKTGGLKILLDNLIAANAPKANPTTQATVAITSASSSLPVGNYYVAYTFVDPLGETTLGSSESAQFTQADNAHLATVTLPSLPAGCQAINIYLTDPNMPSGTETLYASGVTATTFALSYALPADQPTQSTPTQNTTGAVAHVQRIYSLLPLAATEKTLERLSEDLSNYLSGYPMERRSVIVQHTSWQGIVALWNQAMGEICSLVLNNMPSATSNNPTAVGMPLQRWVLP